MAPCAPYVVVTDPPAWCQGAEVTDANRVLQEATDILWGLTGRWINGICRSTVRPWLRNSICGPHGFWGGPGLGLYGSGLGGGFGPFGVGGSCDHTRWIRLPGGILQGTGLDPVVKIDGAVYADWAVVDGLYLARRDGASWPLHQNILLPDTEVGTFSVTASSGEAAEPLMAAATVELAQELWRQEQEKARRIPANATSASAQGVNVSFDPLQPQETSLPQVQAAVQHYNPLNQQVPPQWSGWDEPWILHVVS